MSDPFHGTLPGYSRPLAPPHLWFAWFPIETFDGRRIWLRKVWRQRLVFQMIDDPALMSASSPFYFRYAVVAA